MVFEAIGNILNAIFNPVLSPLLSLPPVWSLLIISFFIALVSTLAYKYVTNQDLMKRLKTEMKELQKELKTLRDQPEKLMQVQKKAMETNMKYMTQSFKPTLVTFIPLILIFAWLSGNLAYDPLLPQEPFELSVEMQNHLGENIHLLVPEGIELLSEANQTVNSDTVSWRLQGAKGSYDVQIDFADNKYSKDVIISDERGEYASIEETVNDENIKKITLSNAKTTPFGTLIKIFSWTPGWLATYIFFSIVFSLVLRRLLKVA